MVSFYPVFNTNFRWDSIPAIIIIKANSILDQMFIYSLKMLWYFHTLFKNAQIFPKHELSDVLEIDLGHNVVEMI